MAITRWCVLASEQDGAELGDEVEVPLDADQVYFTNPNYVADNTQDAILETILKSGAARTPYGFYYDANANTGRWLEVSKGVSSLTSPHVIPEFGIIKAITVSVKLPATCDIGIFLNGVLIYTVSLSAQDTAQLSGLNTVVNTGDELSAQVISGTCSEPNVQTQVQVSA